MCSSSVLVELVMNCNVYARSLILCLCHYVAVVHNELQCVNMQELCQKFVTLFVLIIRISFASCCNEMSAQMN
jgi:hypothetical protein